MTKIPKELDILPPRPVLFPWLPSTAECFLDFGLASCCFGGEETAALEKHPASRAPPPDIRSVFSFDDDEEEFVDCINGTEDFEAEHESSPVTSSESSTVSGDDRHRRSLKPLFGEETVASGERTTTILVLSRRDDYDEIPDISSSDDNSEAGSYRSSDSDDDGSRDYHRKADSNNNNKKIIRIEGDTREPHGRPRRGYPLPDVLCVRQRRERQAAPLSKPRTAKTSSQEPIAEPIGTACVPKIAVPRIHCLEHCLNRLRTN